VEVTDAAAARTHLGMTAHGRSVGVHAPATLIG
jgi:hypothetical protein